MASASSLLLLETSERRPSMFEMNSSSCPTKLARNRETKSCLRTHTDNPSIFNRNKAEVVRYMNTYKMDPETNFPVQKVERIAEEVLQDYLEDFEYQEVSACRLCKLISDNILQTVKNLRCKRHKIVVVVNIGQLQGQDVRVGSRCLWQLQHDNFAEACYEGKGVWSTATVYGIYQD